MHVDPGNRLVADSLEAEWNQKLRELERVQEESEQLRQAERASLSEEQSNAIVTLTADFPGCGMTLRPRTEIANGCLHF